ncbi:MAG: hypothetical protein O9301_13775 [Leptospira sp.]|nr:hypothetical protein [Leptospira sp.]
MRNQINLGLLLVLSFFLSFEFCKKTENPADIPPAEESLPNFYGDWILEWEDTELLVSFSKEEKTVTISNGFSEPLILDSKGIRIQPRDEERLLGYFLFTDLKKKTWIGTWDERIVRLRRKL